MIRTVHEARERLAELAAGAPLDDPGAVRLELDGRIARLAIDHPRARSAMTLQMMVQLADAVLALQPWDGSLVLLSSTDPRSFCAGGHVAQLVRALTDPDRVRAMSEAMTTVLEGLGELSAVSVAAIDGLALGGGAELLTATDFRVASPETRIHFIQARLGIAQGWGGARRLVRIVGRQAALRILTTARPMFPGEAVDVGLVDHRCEGPASEGAVQWLADLLERPPDTIRAAKRQVLAAAVDGPDGRAADVAAFAAVWGSPAHQQALAGDRGRITVPPEPSR